jgi:hypothetical protein
MKLGLEELAQDMITLYESVEEKNSIENVTAEFAVHLKFNKKYKMKIRLELIDKELDEL